MAIDKSTEYDSLRQEILDLITAKDNFVIAMYTITTAVLCVAFELENPILFLVPYIVLFAFQYNISAKNENMVILAAYIAVYLEEGQGWESQSQKHREAMRNGEIFHKPKSIWKILVGRLGSAQLGLLCSISCILHSVPNLKETWLTTSIIEPIVYIALSVILYLLIRVQTKNALKLRSRKEKYIQNLKATAETQEYASAR